MKIAITMYPINSLGGLVNRVENMSRGFMETGHSVDLYFLYWKESVTAPKHSDSDLLKKQGWAKGVFCAYHQCMGWNLPANKRLAYKGESNKRAQDILSKYDIVIWITPVPTKQKDNQGNSDWVKLYDACKCSIATITDGNLFNNPHIYAIASKLKGLACVHTCAYNLSAHLPVPRAMIFSPQNMNRVWDDPEPYRERDRSFFSLQTFKKWKHVEDIVRAVPYMSDKTKKILAGGGLEQAYMTSPDKTKPEYYARRKEDPDLSLTIEEKHIHIWDRALKYKMEWLGWIDVHLRDSILKSTRLLVDPSWSVNYAKHGDHFNRVIIEGIMQGVIPVARNLGVSTNLKGEGSVFKPDIHYKMIPYDATPKRFAEAVEDFLSMSNNDADRIRSNNLKLLPNWDRKNVAQQFIDLSKGKPTGFFKKLEVGKRDSMMEIESRKVLKSFFGINTKIDTIFSFIK